MLLMPLLEECLTRDDQSLHPLKGSTDPLIGILLLDVPARKTSRLVHTTNLRERLPEDLDSKPICALTVRQRVQWQIATH